MTTEAPTPDLEPLAPLPETDEMIDYLKQVAPILLNIPMHAAKADEYAARLHERGIDYREYLTGSVD